jgi:hypothetical protein
MPNEDTNQWWGFPLLGPIHIYIPAEFETKCKGPIPPLSAQAILQNGPTLTCFQFGKDMCDGFILDYKAHLACFHIRMARYAKALGFSLDSWLILENGNGIIPIGPDHQGQRGGHY